MAVTLAEVFDPTRDLRLAIQRQQATITAFAELTKPMVEWARLVNVMATPQVGNWQVVAASSPRSTRRLSLTTRISRKVGRKPDTAEQRQQKREHLRAAVIRHAEEGWRKYPLAGPSRRFVAQRLLLETEAGLRHQLRRRGVDFDKCVAEAYRRVFGRSWTKLGS
jgi:hypothetical protein